MVFYRSRLSYNKLFNLKPASLRTYGKLKNKYYLGYEKQIDFNVGTVKIISYKYMFQQLTRKYFITATYLEIKLHVNTSISTGNNRTMCE